IFPVTGLHSEQSRSAQFAQALATLQDAMQRMKASVEGLRSLALAERLLKAGASFFMPGDVTRMEVQYSEQAVQMAALHVHRAVALEPRILTECLTTDENAPYHRDSLKPPGFNYKRGDS
ncbi:hypothetical protein HK405_000714, partial [Cladochytrium tenue]